MLKKYGILVIALCCSIFFFMAIIAQYKDPSFALLGSIACFSLLLPIFHNFYYSQAYWWHPIHIFSLLMFYSYAGRFLLFCLFPRTAAREGFVSYFNNQALCSQMLWLTLIAGTSYYIGYLVAYKYIRKRSKTAKYFLLDRLSQISFDFFKIEEWNWLGKLLIVSTSIGLITRLIAISLGVYNHFVSVANPEAAGFATPLFSFEEYNRLAYGISCIVLIESFTNTKIPNWIKFASLGFIVQEILFLLFVRGSKTYLLLSVLFIVFYYFISELGRARKFNLKIFFNLVIIGLLVSQSFSFTFDYIFVYRQNYNKIIGNKFEVSGQLLDVTQKSIDDVFARKTKIDENASSEIRFAGLDPLALILTKVPNKVDFLYFRDLITIPFSPIPRILFPFKPAPVSGETMSYKIANANGVGITMFPIGEGYLNLGAIGVAILMFLFGYFHNILFAWLYFRSIVKYLFFALLPLILYRFYSLETALIPMLGGIMQIAIAFLPVWYLLQNYQKKLIVSIDRNPELKNQLNFYS
jgi:hypothetical protein